MDLDAHLDPFTGHHISVAFVLAEGSPCVAETMADPDRKCTAWRGCAAPDLRCARWLAAGRSLHSVARLSRPCSDGRPYRRSREVHRFQRSPLAYLPPPLQSCRP